MKRTVQITSRKGRIDPMLAAIISEIHKTVETPAKGFLTKNEWGEKWRLNRSQAGRYIEKAVKSGMMLMHSYRILLRGRPTKMKHYGPPPGKKRKPS